MVKIKDIILFYSEYPKNCQNIFIFINKYNLRLTTVCIDKKVVRTHIRNDKLFNITHVPTLIVVYENGEAEKYEGAKIIEYMKQLIEYTEKGLDPHGRKETPQTAIPIGEEYYAPETEEIGGEQVKEIGEPEEGTYEVIGGSEGGTSLIGGGGGGGNVKEQQFSAIRNLAKEMEEQRNKVLNYDASSDKNV